MLRKPLIGVTSNFNSINALSTSPDDFVFVRANYVNAILENGGIPLIIPSTIAIQDAKYLVAGLDGILFIGGQDVDPKCYGEECQIDYTEVLGSGIPYQRPLRDQPNYARDIFEIELYNVAKQRKLPIVGICRGYQLINVAEGGSLFQEIAINEVIHTMAANDIVPDHEIMIAENSHAHEVFGSMCFVTCSIHHQGIKALGANLVATGFAKDGLIEVIESADPEHFLLGMQGHPERSGKYFAEHNYLFAEFIAACLTKS